MSDIGDAIQEMREGGKVKRAKWKGKWLELDGATIMLVDEDGDKRGYLAVDDELVAGDLAADDWEAVD
jgi:hypothetical protein